MSLRTSGASPSFLGNYPWFRYSLKYTWQLLEQCVSRCHPHYSESVGYSIGSVCLTFMSKSNGPILLPPVLLRTWESFCISPLTLSSLYKKKKCGLTSTNTKWWDLHFQQQYRTKCNLTLCIANCTASLPFVESELSPLAWFCQKLSSQQFR